MPRENEFTKLNPICPDPGRWSADDLEASENEVADFLYGLVRLIKPGTIVETGCYKGNGTIAIARAVKDNGFGELFSCDIDGKLVGEVKEKLKSLELPGMVMPIRGDVLLDQLVNVDFAFIDSGGNDREEEIGKLLKLMRPYSMFALHDTAPQHEKLNKLANSIALPKVYFNTPRGLTLFQRI